MFSCFLSRVFLGIYRFFPRFLLDFLGFVRGSSRFFGILFRVFLGFSLFLLLLYGGEELMIGVEAAKPGLGRCEAGGG